MTYEPSRFDEQNSAIEQDRRLQRDPEPQLGAGRARTPEIVLTLLASTAIVAIVLYGLNAQRSESEQANAPNTAQTAAAPPAQGQQNTAQQRAPQPAAAQPNNGQPQQQQAAQPQKPPATTGQNAADSNAPAHNIPPSQPSNQPAQQAKPAAKPAATGEAPKQ